MAGQKKSTGGMRITLKMHGITSKADFTCNQQKANQNGTYFLDFLGMNHDEF